jgi:protein SDA1
LLDRKQKRKHRGTFQKNFLPIDVLYDPQGFTEKLFRKLSKGRSKKKEVKGETAILVLRLIAKLIGRHKLTVPEFFSHANHLIKQNNKELPKLLACIAEACHENLQKEDVRDIIGTITDNLITDNCPPEFITMGLNTVREIAARMPQVLDKDELSYLVLFQDFKNKYVASAAKSLINLYRDISPDLLPKKLR